MDLLRTLLVYMSLVFATSVQTAPEPAALPDGNDYSAAYAQTTPAPTAVATPVPTINITPNPAYKTLQVGDKGANVRAMQEKLQEYGYYTGEIDGAYGNQSRKAVEQFQYMHGLTVDGIAGRHTLTVLFESKEIRLPEGGEIPEPTPETQLEIAITPTPAPVLTPLPLLTATPLPTVVPASAAKMEPVSKLEDYQLVVNGADVQAEVYKRGDAVYLPVIAVLNELGINVISSSSVEMDEYAFALDMNLIRFTHTENQQEEPIDLQIYRNDEPQLVPDRNLYKANDVLYMPLKSIEYMLGLPGTVDDEEMKVFITSVAE